MTETEYTAEQFREEFDSSSTLQGKHDAILKAVSHTVEFGGSAELKDEIKECKQQLIESKKDFQKEEDEICNKDIDSGKYELHTCIKTFYTPSFAIQEGTKYYVRVEDPRSTLGEMWSEVGTDEIKRIIGDMKPIIWVITDNGIGTLKSRNSFREEFENYFSK